MNEQFRERCQQFCKESDKCFSENHVACLKDIFLNKIHSIHSLLETTDRMATIDELRGIIALAKDDLNDVVAWIDRLKLTDGSQNVELF